MSGVLLAIEPPLEVVVKTYFVRPGQARYYARVPGRPGRAALSRVSADQAALNYAVSYAPAGAAVYTLERDLKSLCKMAHCSERARADYRARGVTHLIIAPAGMEAPGGN